jgi:hypothetical protein
MSAQRVGQRVGMTFAMTQRQRVLWAIGSPARAIGVVLVVGALCWLSAVSIGWAAVRVILAIVLAGHWLSYVLAGRNRLSLDDDGIYDHVRFHKRFYPWSQIASLEAATPIRHLHGLVVELASDQPEAGQSVSAQKFLRSSWRPSLAEAQAMLADIVDYFPHLSAEDDDE